MYCPKCEKLNQCDCKNCNPNGDKKDLLIILEDEGLYQCCYCGHKFHEQDSLDFEWDRMINEFAKIATPELCYEWMRGETYYGKLGRTQNVLQKELGIGELAFTNAIGIHFKKPYKMMTREDIDNIKVQLLRNSKLDKLIK